jgi:hypothetical protein
MTKRLSGAAVGTLVLIAGVGAAAYATSYTSTRKEADTQIARGKYLVNIIGCNDCHTPLKMGANGPQPDMDRMLSGHPEDLVIASVPKTLDGQPWLMAGAATSTAFAGPWGVSFAANLTPDDNTGIGIWPEELFIKTLRTGRHWGTSRPILPPMPWTAFRNMTDDDLKAVYAYLRTIKPVTNHVPAPVEPEESLFTRR